MMGKTKFSDYWSGKEDVTGRILQEWCAKSTDDDSSFYRKICKKTLSYKKGFQALLQHAAKKEHKMNASNVINPRQLRLIESTSTKEV